MIAAAYEAAAANIPSDARKHIGHERPVPGVGEQECDGLFLLRMEKDQLCMDVRDSAPPKVQVGLRGCFRHEGKRWAWRGDKLPRSRKNSLMKLDIIVE
jgi:hypothetical protein